MPSGSIKRPVAVPAPPLAKAQEPLVPGTLAYRLQEVLDLRKWSARELSRRAALKSESHVSLLMTGKGVRLETLKAIADAADVSLEWLASGIGTPAATKREEQSVAPAFPIELRSAMGARPVSPATRAALAAVAKEQLSEKDWSTYITLLEFAEVWRAQAVSSSAPEVRSRAIEEAVRVASQGSKRLNR